MADAELLAFRDRLAAARTEVSAVAAALPPIQEQARLAGEPLAAAQAVAADVHALLDAARRAADELASVSATLQSARTELAALEAQLATLERDIAATSLALQRARAQLFPPPDPIRIQQLQNQLAALRAQADTLRQQIAERRQRIAALETRAAELEPLAARVPQLETDVTRADAVAAALTPAADEARRALAAALQREAAARAEVAAIIRLYNARLDALLAALSPQLPILLLPVRLETRFALQADGSTHLLVRIYPDDIVQDTHRAELTAEEAKWGTAYATQMAEINEHAPDADAKRRRVWIPLAQRFGVPRAAWIARRVSAGTSAPDGTGSWTRPPLARVLPDRWLVLGHYAGARELLARSAPVLAPLATGPSPDAAAPRRPLADSGFEVEDAMRWMVDFEEAVAVGMGVRIPLTAAQAQRGFDTLVVYGVRLSTDATEATEELGALLDAHHFTWGLGIVPQGSPTNNTDESASGHGARADAAASYRIERGPALCAARDDSDGTALAGALGIDPSVLAHVAHADGRDQRAAGDMIQALWPATWGYFLQEMLFDGFRGTDLEAWRAWVARHVRARGPLPALRVGNQPYGVLPVTSLDRWQPAASLPELLLFHVANPVGENTGAYRVGWDLTADGGPSNWGDVVPVPGWFGAENQGGALAAYDLTGSGRPDLLVVHVDNPGGENAVYYRVGWRLDGRGAVTGGWKAPVPIPGRFGAETRAIGVAVTPVPGRTRPALVVYHIDHPDMRIVGGPGIASRGAGLLDVFGRTAANTIWQKRFEREWGNWESLGPEQMVSDPTAVSWEGGRIDLMARGRDNAVWQRTFLDGRWSAWSSLGGSATSGPAVCSWGAGRLDLFVRTTGNTVATRSYGRGWSAWTSLGPEQITSDPAAVSWGSGRIDLFARGTDNALWHKWYQNGWSAGWESLGGRMASGPTCCSWGAGRLDVFGRGTDNALWHRWFENGWSAWESLGGSLASDPAATAWGPGRIDVVATTEDGRLNRLTFASRWGAWETLTERDRAYYRVGWDLDTSGNVIGGWSTPVALPGMISDAVGGGLAVADLNGSGTPDLVAFHVERASGSNRGVYRVGWELGSGGEVSGWSGAMVLPWSFGAENQGAAIAVALLGEDERPSLLVLHTERVGGDNQAYLHIGSDIAPTAAVGRWSGQLNAAPAPLGPQIAGVGIAVGNVGRRATPGITSATGLVNWLASLRDVWRRSVTAVPRAGAGDPNTTLVRMLGMEPTSNAFAARTVLGSQYMLRLWNYLQQQLDTIWLAEHRSRTLAGRQALGLTRDPRLAHGAFANVAAELYGPLVQRGGGSETQRLDPNVIAWLRTATPQELHSHALPANYPRDSLLYLVLRQAVLWEFAQAAYRVAERIQQPVDPKLPRDPELIDIPGPGDVPAGGTLTPWRQLNKPMGAAHGNRTIAEYLQALAKSDPTHPEVAGIVRVRAALGQLETLPTAALERLLAETLDLSTTRLDAWLTAVATERLAWLRAPARRPTGIALGAYGWVEGLRPNPARASTGFVHAPSLAHAATAAILRSGYQAHGGDPALGVDLSSARVRLATTLLDGVRQGQPLGTLLGYRFERGLHENHPGLELDKYVRRFRELAPLTARKQVPSTAPADQVAAANVVDGLALLRRWQTGKRTDVWDATTIPFGNADFPSRVAAGAPPRSTEESEFLALAAELDLLDDAIDATSDAVLAEGVYQVVQGNPLRAGAGLDAISRGEVPPPALEVVRSARSGVGLTHRLAALFEGAPSEQDPFVALWDPGDAAARQRQVRARAEPQLNAWAARLLGDPARVRCRVEYADPATGASLGDREITLLELALSPLDVVYAAASVPAAPRAGAGRGAVYSPAPSEIEERVRLCGCAVGPTGAAVRLDFERASTWGPEVVSFPELLEVARTVRELFVSGRALQPRDLVQLGDAEQPPALDVTELRGRADAAVSALGGPDGALKKLQAALADVTTGAAALREAILAIAYFGIEGAMPVSLSGGDAAAVKALRAQGKRLEANVLRRVQELEQAKVAFDRKGQAAEQAHDSARLRDVFGSEFRVLPRFRPYGAADLAAALNAATGADAMAPVMWLQRVARVRAGAGRLDTALLHSEATSGGDAPRLRVAQLPHVAGEPWVGLDGPVRGGRLSIVAHMPGASGLTVATSWLCGLLIDEWVEVVPNKEETTAVTFHFDAPASAAPQSLLLAVAPDVRRRWSEDTLEAILLETFEMSKLRLVDLDALGESGHYLPGLYFAFNSANDTISADVNAAAGTPP